MRRSRNRIKQGYGLSQPETQAGVDRVDPVMNLPPIDARSPDIKTGVANIPAVQQQYGRNFGVSVVPYRPAPPVFSAPGGLHR
jgi:hypothetical protein